MQAGSKGAGDGRGELAHRARRPGEGAGLCWGRQTACRRGWEGICSTPRKDRGHSGGGRGAEKPALRPGALGSRQVLNVPSKSRYPACAPPPPSAAAPLSPHRVPCFSDSPVLSCPALPRRDFRGAGLVRHRHLSASWETSRPVSHQVRGLVTARTGLDTPEK